MQEESFLYQEDDLVYKILTPMNRDAAMIVLARAFCTEPVCSAVVEIRPDLVSRFHDWVEFVECWMDHCSTNNLSVIAIDVKNHRVAGAFIARDFFFFPQGFLETFGPEADSDKSLRPWMSFLLHLDSEAQRAHLPLAQAKLGDAVDLWLLGVHPDYRGRKIANHLVRLSLILAQSAGFKYATIEATNAFTSKAAILNNFQKIVQIEAKDWLWNGAPLYTNAPAPHGNWTFWIKDLSNSTHSCFPTN